MAEVHVHSVLKPEDFAAARDSLKADLSRMIVKDAIVFGVLAVLFWFALYWKLDADFATNSGLIWGLPFVFLVLTLGSSLARVAYLYRHASRRLRELEARALSGESVSCAEFDLPEPIRAPSWLR